MTYTEQVTEYAKMVANKAADTDLPVDVRAEVSVLLIEAAQQADRRAAIATARAFGTDNQYSIESIDRAVDILSNL